MKKALQVFAVLVFLMGLVWFLQGINVLLGSPMSGTTTWTINGAIAMVIGGGLFWFARRKQPMDENFQIGDRVEVYLDEKFGDKEGWYAGTVFKIDPYSEHRNFYWVNFEAEAQAVTGARQISVFNPKNIRKLK